VVFVAALDQALISRTTIEGCDYFGREPTILKRGETIKPENQPTTVLSASAGNRV
jgi:hypothetical protein